IQINHQGALAAHGADRRKIGQQGGFAHPAFLIEDNTTHQSRSTNPPPTGNCRTKQVLILTQPRWPDTKRSAQAGAAARLAFLRSCSFSQRLRMRIEAGVISTSSSSLMNSNACSSDICTG